MADIDTLSPYTVEPEADTTPDSSTDTTLDSASDSDDDKMHTMTLRPDDARALILTLPPSTTASASTSTTSCPDTASVRRGPAVTFAPLPEADLGRPRKYSLGVAARAKHLRQRRAGPVRPPPRQVREETWGSKGSTTTRRVEYGSPKREEGEGGEDAIVALGRLVKGVFRRSSSHSRRTAAAAAAEPVPPLPPALPIASQHQSTPPLPRAQSPSQPEPERTAGILQKHPDTLVFTQEEELTGGVWEEEVSPALVRLQMARAASDSKVMTMRRSVVEAS